MAASLPANATMPARTNGRNGLPLLNQPLRRSLKIMPGSHLRRSTACRDFAQRALTATAQERRSFKGWEGVRHHKHRAGGHATLHNLNNIT